LSWGHWLASPYLNKKWNKCFVKLFCWKMFCQIYFKTLNTLIHQILNRWKANTKRNIRGVYWIKILRNFKRLFYLEKVLWYSIKTLCNLKKVLWYSIKILCHLKKVLSYSIKTLHHLKKVLWYSKSFKFRRIV